MFLERALGEWFVWGELKLSLTFGGSSLLLPALSKEQAACDPLDVEGESRWLLSRDNHCEERKLLQPEFLNVQLEEGSLNHKHLPFAME